MSAETSMILKKQFVIMANYYAVRIADCKDEPGMDAAFALSANDTASLAYGRKVISLAMQLNYLQLTSSISDEDRGANVINMMPILRETIEGASIDTLQHPSAKEAVEILKDIVEEIVVGLNEDNPRPVVDPRQGPLVLKKQFSITGNPHMNKLMEQKLKPEMDNFHPDSPEYATSLTHARKVLDLAAELNAYQTLPMSDEQRGELVLGLMPHVHNAIEGRPANPFIHPAEPEAMKILQDITEEVVDGLNADNPRPVVEPVQALKNRLDRMAQNANTLG